jgi:hypothetical protein
MPNRALGGVRRIVAAAVAVLAIATAAPAPAGAALTPVPDCRTPGAIEGTYLVYYGYVNDGAPTDIDFGPQNQVIPGFGFQGQPTVFNTGSYPRVFRATFNSNVFMAIAWELNGLQAIATTATPLCAAGATGPASDVGLTSATLNGVVESENVPTTYRFEYGTTIAYGQTTPEQEITAPSAKLVSAPLGDLAPGTTYHYRLVADGTESTVGEDRTFTTSAPPPPPDPGATTAPASDVGRTGATLNGVVESHGEPTTYRFAYGPTDAYGSMTPERVLSSTAAALVSEPLTDLAPGTTYHYRLIADGTGAANGADATFTTRESPPAPPSPIALADLVVTSEGPARTRVGRSVAITFTITNAGPDAATGVHLSADVPRGLRVKDVQGPSGQCAGQRAWECPLGALAPGATAVVHMRVAPRRPGKFDYRARVAAEQPEITVSDNHSAGELRARR